MVGARSQGVPRDHARPEGHGAKQPRDSQNARRGRYVGGEESQPTPVFMFKEVLSCVVVGILC